MPAKHIAARAISTSHARLRSIGLPIVLGAIAVVLTVALLVGWTLVLVQNISLTQEEPNIWLLVAGVIFFCVILTVVLLFSVVLVREILEVRRQYTFVDSVTHELKSPLASLKLCLETLQRSELNEAQRELLRQMMLGDVDRLSEFIDDVLEASRIQHGKRGYMWSEVRVAEVIARCIANVQRRYKLDDSVFDVRVPHDLSLTTDATALETAIKNLLDNAVKYSRDEVRVKIEARRESDRLELEVRDEGIGIPKQHLKRIFHRFYRVPLEAVYSRRGTGLGLFVVASLVRGIGGRLEAHSDGVGWGTSMRLLLPSAPAKES